MIENNYFHQLSICQLNDLFKYTKNMYYFDDYLMKVRYFFTEKEKRKYTSRIKFKCNQLEALFTIFYWYCAS